jgi:hypothetical protein
MSAIGLLLVRMLCDFFRPRPRLEAEILILRHQLNVLQQRTPRRRLHLRWVDRALFIWLYRGKTKALFFCPPHPNGNWEGLKQKTLSFCPPHPNRIWISKHSR